MILVVGHGPSSQKRPRKIGRWIDEQEYVVRCDTATHRKKRRAAPSGYKVEFHPHVGTKSDFVVTTDPHVRFSNAGVWHEHVYREEIRSLSNQFVDRKRQKLSTGTVACCIAKLIKFPDSEVGVIGFDTTMGGIYLAENRWYHDAEGERELLRYLGIKDYAVYG